MRYLPILLVLTGCSSIPKVPDHVYIPVTKSCITGEIIKPEFTTHEKLKVLSDSDFIKQMTIELFKYESYTGELEAQIIGCK